MADQCSRRAEVSAEWLVQFGQMGSTFATARYGIERPRVGLLSIGEEDSKGTALVKEANAPQVPAGFRQVPASPAFN